MMDTRDKIAEDVEKARTVMDNVTPETVLGKQARQEENTSENMTGQSNSVRSASEVYQDIAGSQDKVCINDLMAKAGVTQEDFQAVCDDHPEIIQNIGGGATCQKLAESANKVKNSYGPDGKIKTGSCLSGVNKIYNSCKVDSLTNRDAYKYKAESVKPYQKGVPGGSCGYEVLEKSGKFISLFVKNKAYGSTMFKQENSEMNDFFNKVQPGVTVTVDDISDNTVRNKLGNTAGGKWGHITVKQTSDKFACDFVQKSINFSRYGEYAHACYPKDASISKEYAEMVITKAQERQTKDNQKAGQQQQEDNNQQPNTNQQTSTMQYALASRANTR